MKDLYKASCLSDLEKLIADPIQLNSPTEVREQMLKCFQSACNQRTVDEEDAYLSLRRYFEFYDQLKKMKDVGSKSVLSDAQFKKQCLLAMDYLEELHSNLKKRYEQLATCLNLISLLPSPPDSSKEQHPSVTTASSDKIVTTTAKDSKPFMPWISPEALVNLMKKKENLLIFDVRTPEDFSLCRLKYSRLIHISLSLILNGKFNFSLLSQKMSEGDSNEFWTARGDADHIVLLDHATCCQSPSEPIARSLSASHPLCLLKNAIYKYDAQKSLKVEPQILNGGIVEFVRRYAPLTTNPSYRVQLDNDVSTLDDAPEASVIAYPKVPDKTAPVVKLENSHEPLIDHDKVVPRKPDETQIIENSVPISPTLEDRLRELRTKKPEDSSTLKRQVSLPKAQTLSASQVNLASAKPQHSSSSSLTNDSTTITNKSSASLNQASVIAYPKVPDKTAPIVKLENDHEPLIDHYKLVPRKPDETQIIENSVPISPTLEDRLQELRTKKPEDSSTLKRQVSLPKIDRTCKPPVTSPSPPNWPEDTNTPEQLELTAPNSARTLSASQVNLASAKPQHTSSSLTNDSTTIANKSSASLNQGSFPVSMAKPIYPSCRQRPNGLRNLGNTCYMNAVLQSLAHNRTLASFFLRGLDDKFTNVTNPWGHGGKFSTQFRRLFTEIWVGDDCSSDLMALKLLIGNINPTFSGSDQQDSLEFLIFLLDALHEDMNEGSRNNTANDSASSDEEQMDPQIRGTHSWNKYLEHNNSIIVRAFQGQLFSTIQCDRCNKQSSRFDAFVCLTLPLPFYSPCTLQQCLTLFGNPEKIGANYKCARCKQCTNATKRLCVWKLPPYLIIHLKRFKYTGQTWEKSTTYVNFPVDEFRPQNDSSCYALYAVVNHFGSMEGGHYTAFCRGVSDNQWYEYDDRVVKQIPSSHIQSSAAYILFYERLPRIDVFSTSLAAR